jgi:predicted transcriptional regulator
MGQVIGTVNVQMGQSANPRVSTVTYGSRTLKGAIDFNTQGIADGDVIVYQANTNSFISEPVSALQDISLIDGGFF